MANEHHQPVIVMLSTYNGERYLKQQLASILAQSGVELSLYIRDDGSTDRTPQILSEYSQQANVFVQNGQNEGWKRSFTDLMHSVPEVKGAYYAFADQDDVWKPEKMQVAVQQLADFTQPAVYHSNVAIVDGNMHFLKNRFDDDFQPNSNFPASFLDGLGVGATMVFNAEMLSLIQRYQPQTPTNHDAFVMALANMLGQVVYDPTPHILYRRHGGTATGFGAGTDAAKPTLIDRYRRYKKGPKQQFSIRAAELLAGYAALLTPTQVQLLTQIATYRTRFGSKVALLFSPRIRATGVRKSLQIKYRVLMNTL